MSGDALETFVGQMSVADFCAKLGYSVEELVERSSPRPPASFGP